MKNLFLTASVIFTFGIANAQDAETEGAKGFAKGDVFIAGSVGFGTTKTGDFKTNSFTIAPSAGFFISENIALGAQIGYTSQKNDNGIGGTVDASQMEVGVFGRYYVTPASDFSLFAELGAGYVTIENPDDTKDKGFGIGFAPGVSYFVSEHFALEAAVGLLSYSSFEEDGAADKTNAFNVGLNFANIQLGLVYKF